MEQNVEETFFQIPGELLPPEFFINTVSVVIFRSHAILSGNKIQKQRNESLWQLKTSNSVKTHGILMNG